MTAVDTSAAEVERVAAVFEDDTEMWRISRKADALLSALASERDAAVKVCEACQKALTMPPASLRADRAWAGVDAALTAWRAARGGSDGG